MLVETILADFLLADTTVTGVVNQRIYLRHMPRTPTFPLIVYHHIDAPLSDKTTGIFQQRIQYDCIATTAAAAKTLAKKVRDALHGNQHKGVYDDVRISYIEYQDMNPGETDTDIGLETVNVDFVVTYMET